MARRDLSRTVIEGGRTRFNKADRRASNGIARARQRVWLDRLRAEPDVAESGTPRARTRVRPSFDDKLAVAERWMRTQCGRRWNEVHGELLARFDSRTVAGRHILFGHILRDVRGVIDDAAWRVYLFEIDEEGILRALPSWREQRKLAEKPRLPPWTDGFHAVRHDGRWWWIGDRIVNDCVQLTRCGLAHAYGPGRVARHFTRATLIRPMTSTDVGRLTSSPPRVRDMILWRGPVLDPADARLAR